MTGQCRETAANARPRPQPSYPPKVFCFFSQKRRPFSFLPFPSILSPKHTCGVPGTQYVTCDLRCRRGSLSPPMARSRTELVQRIQRAARRVSSAAFEQRGGISPARLCPAPDACSRTPGVSPFACVAPRPASRVLRTLPSPKTSSVAPRCGGWISCTPYALTVSLRCEPPTASAGFGGPSRTSSRLVSSGLR